MEFNTMILTRIAANLQKEANRQEGEVLKRDLEYQIEVLKSAKTEVDNFRMIKELLKK